MIPLGAIRAKPERNCEASAGDVATALNDHPTSIQRVATTDEGRDGIMMATLRNKNKRKGFKQSMTSQLPRKIIFHSDDNVVANGSPDSQLHEKVATMPTADNPAWKQIPLALLVPPSEKQQIGDLPPRMFVTSVDVEHGMWDKPNRKNKQKPTSGDWVKQVHTDGVDICMEDRAQTDLVLNPEAFYRCGVLDWDRIENDWENFMEVKEAEQLVVGSLVGWKVCF